MVNVRMFRTRKRKGIAFLLVLPVAAAMGMSAATPAFAGTGVGLTPTFASPFSTVPTNGLAGSLQIVNDSTTPENAGSITVNTLTLTPSCGGFGGPAGCSTAAKDPGVITLSSTGTGRGGTACAGSTFAFTITDATTDKYTITPSAPAIPIVLGPPGSATDTCVIDFTYNIAKNPTKDADPAQAGVQTAQVATSTVTSAVDGTKGAAVGTSTVTFPTSTWAPVRSFTVSRHAGSLTFRWNMASQHGVLGFRIYAGARSAGVARIRMHAGHRYAVTTRTYAGPFKLGVVMTNGTHIRVSQHKAP